MTFNTLTFKKRNINCHFFYTCSHFLCRCHWICFIAALKSQYFQQFSYEPVYFFKGHFIFPGCQFSHMRLQLGEELRKNMFYLKLPVDSLQLLELKHSAGLSHYLTHRATYSLPAQPVQPLGVNLCYLLTLREVGSIISLYKYTQVTAVSVMFLFYCSNIILINRHNQQFSLSVLSTLLTEKQTSVSLTSRIYVK